MSAREGDNYATNQAWWDERATLHARSSFYDIQKVVEGETRLSDYEITEMGDVKNRSLLHLQCHIGTETISWARLGANVTGLDFSKTAVATATELSKRSGISARFVQGSVYDAAELVGKNAFDCVYVNIGSLHWLSDIGRWARAVNNVLVPGGKLYVNEIHPISSVLAESGPTFERDYFDTSGVIWDEPGSYADTPDTQNNKHVIWDRPISEIITAVMEAGLTLTSFAERAGQEYQQFPYQIQHKDGKWYNPTELGIHPSTFSISALKRVV